MVERTLRAGMVGIGMIFDETYRPFFEACLKRPLFDRTTGPVNVELGAVASRTGKRAEVYRRSAPMGMPPFVSTTGDDCVGNLLRENVDFVCVATPDDRHFESSKAVLNARKHLIVEKPSVLKLAELDELVRLARDNGVLAKVVYHHQLGTQGERVRTHAVPDRKSRQFREPGSRPFCDIRNVFKHPVPHADLCEGLGCTRPPRTAVVIRHHRVPLSGQKFGEAQIQALRDGRRRMNHHQGPRFAVGRLPQCAANQPSAT